MEEIVLTGAGLEGHRQKTGDTTTVAAQLVESAGLARTRGYGAISTVKQTIGPPAGIIRERVFGGASAIWTSGVYVRYDLPSTPIIAQDRGDPTKFVFRVTDTGSGYFAGGIAAASIDIPAAGTTGFHVATSGEFGSGGTTAALGKFHVDPTTGDVTSAGAVTLTGTLGKFRTAASGARVEMIANTPDYDKVNFYDGVNAGPAQLFASSLGATAYFHLDGNQRTGGGTVGGITIGSSTSTPTDYIIFDGDLIRMSGGVFDLDWWGGIGTGYMDMEHTTATPVATPAAGVTRIYSKADAGSYHLFYMDDGGAEFGPLGSGGGGTISGAFALTGDISPAQITADQNDYNPAGLSTASVLRLDTSSNWSITGLAGGSDGRVLFAHLITTGAGVSITLPDSSASSTAANRFLCPNGIDYTLGPKGSAMLVYDATSSRWRVLPTPSLSNATPTTVNATAGTPGVASNAARTDHAHQHATISTGALHTDLAALAAANTFTVSPQTIGINAAGNKGLVINLAASQTGRAIEVNDSNGVQAFAMAGSGADILITQYAAIPQITGRRAEGTNTSPTAVAADSVGLGLGFRGYGTSFATQDKANIQLTAAETWSATAQGTYIAFLTTKKAGTTRAEVLRLTDDGGMRITEVTTPAAPPANGAIIYADDNGAGKTRLMVLFNTGAAQQVAIQP